MIRDLVEEVLGSAVWEWLPSACWSTAARMEDVCKLGRLGFLFDYSFWPVCLASIGPLRLDLNSNSPGGKQWKAGSFAPDL